MTVILHLDMRGVTDCTLTALTGLVALLAGSTLLTVTISGARWSQFLTVLAGASVAEIRARRESVRRVIAGVSAPPPTTPA